MLICLCFIFVDLEHCFGFMNGFLELGTLSSYSGRLVQRKWATQTLPDVRLPLELAFTYLQDLFEMFLPQNEVTEATRNCLSNLC